MKVTTMIGKLLIIFFIKIKININNFIKNNTTLIKYLVLTLIKYRYSFSINLTNTL